MGLAFVYPQLCGFNKFLRKNRAGADRHDLVIVALKDEGRQVDLLKVLSEIGFGKRLDAIAGIIMTTFHR
jgi:hypothetical protein